MQKITIKTEARKSTGKNATKELRRKSHVPGVLYGLGEENIHFHAHENDFRHLIYTPNTYLVDIEIDGKAHKAVLKSLSFHPVTDKLEHIDLIRYADDKPVTVKIPIKTAGFSKGVQMGGVLRTSLRKLTVSGLAENLPERIEVNIEKLLIGQSIKVRDLKIENLSFLDPKDSVVVAVKTTRVAAMTEDEEGAEGEGTEEKTEE